MSAFESLEQFRKALKKYQNDDSYTYRSIQEDYGIGSTATITAWFKPVLDGEKTPEEVWKQKTEKRGKQKQEKSEQEKKEETSVDNLEDWNIGTDDQGREKKEEDRTNRNIILLWVAIAIIIFLIYINL